jgi:hypothetical protein
MNLIPHTQPNPLLFLEIGLQEGIGHFCIFSLP